MKFKEMIVDLTPLLDVILILLFMVLASHTQVNEGTIQGMTEEIAYLEARQMPANSTEQGWLETYQESIGKVNVNFSSESEEDQLSITHENGESNQMPTDSELTEWLIQEIEPIEREVIIVTFTYDSEAIYQRDYRSIMQQLSGLSNQLEQTIVYQDVDVASRNETSDE